ncbi:MAG: DUF4157 domain-containing protein [Actinomycetota bacterium]|nr:DUF4157 domain-containing protein [Actinomycetota bacterium]MDQ6945631.1 DUF4157 domain-containing protein [Actinomycetota bacterium]
MVDGRRGASGQHKDEPGRHERGRAAPPANGMLDLQRLAGNRAVGALLRAQAKLEVGAVDDPHEREADAAADRVTAAVRAPAGAARSPVIGRALVQRRMGGPAPGPAFAEPAIEQALGEARSGGVPLAAGVRTSMGVAFGADFGDVRVHQGSAAAGLNRQLGAKAFTVGSDIWFRDGAPALGSKEGTHLLAHELAHTVQQGGAGPARVQRAPAGDQPAPALGGPGPTTTGQGEDATASANAVMADTLPDAGLDGEPVERKGPSDLRTGRDASARRSTTGGGQPVRVSVGSVGVSADVAESASIDSGAGASDSVVAGVSGTAWTSPSGMTVDPFGEEAFKAGYGGLKFTYTENKRTGVRTIHIGFKLKAKGKWGVNSGGHKDVPSGTSSVVTADNYQDIVDDLTPHLQGGSWVPVRQAYWAKALSSRHEKFHATDDKSWIEGGGKAHIINFLNAQAIALTDEELKSKSQFKGKVAELMDDAIDDLDTANIRDFYKGGAGDYYSYAGEIRAFGDGKQPYLDLVAGVKQQGEKLAAKRQEKSARKAGAGTP